MYKKERREGHHCAISYLGIEDYYELNWKNTATSGLVHVGYFNIVRYTVSFLIIK